MDALADIMSLLKTRGHLYGRLELAAPFGFSFPGYKGICIIMLEGNCFLGVDKQRLQPLSAGDFVFLPAPRSYSLRSSPGRVLRPIETVSSEEAFHKSRLISYAGDGGRPATLVAGCFTFASPESEMLVKHLPPLIHLRGLQSGSAAWCDSTLRFIATESAKSLPGSAAIIDRLAEVLFVLAMRTRIESSFSAKPSWLRALGDPQLSEALRLMHGQPDRKWTVAALAKRIAMSRSAFATRFQTVVGEAPMRHLTRWRMVRAANMLSARQPVKLAAIASSVGYDSESSFSKVFRRETGISPGEYRSGHSHL